MRVGPPPIELRDVTLRRAGREVLRDVSLSVEANEVLVLLGESGAGKSTLLDAICGFLRPASGTIVLDGREARWTAPRDRHIGRVFQEPSLWPHRTVVGHLDFVLRGVGRSRSERRERIGEVLERLDLTRLADRRPETLSGGEAKRLECARALITEPRVLLLDEPLSALDGSRREDALSLFREVCASTSAATVWVTHDAMEAFAVGDRAAVLDEGGVAQWAEPHVLAQRPATFSVARRTGTAASVPATRGPDGGWVLPWGASVEVAEGVATTGEALQVLLRPWQVQVVPAAGTGPQGTVRRVHAHEDGWELRVAVGDCEVSARSWTRWAEGSAVSLSVRGPVWAWPCPTEPSA